MLYIVKGSKDGVKRKASAVHDSLVEFDLEQKNIKPFNKETHKEVWLELSPGHSVRQRVRINRLEKVPEMTPKLQ